MSWDKFAHLADDAGQAPTARRRGAQGQPLALPAERSPLPALGLESGAGRGKPNREAEDYAAAARDRLRSPRVPASFWLPDRIRKLTEGRDVGAFLDAYLRDLLAHPYGDQLVEARALFNELGRDPESARILRDRLTPELIERALAAKPQGR